MTHDPPKATIPKTIEAEVLDAIAAIPFGSVNIVIHNHQVVQIDRLEKRRFDPVTLKNNS
jgi:hypothetical protein